MRFFNFFPLVLLAVSGFAHPGFDKQVATIASHVNNMDAAITQYVNSGGSVTRGLVPMLTVRSECGKVIKALDKATSDLTSLASRSNSLLTDEEIHSMSNSFKEMEAVITRSHDVIANNNAFTNFGVRTIFKRDLTKLSARVDAFSKAVLKETPANHLEEGTAIAKRINDAFNRAITLAEQA